MVNGKRLASLTIALLFILQIALAVPAHAQQASIRVDSRPLLIPSGETGTVISQEGRVLIPARWIAEALGVEVAWHPETRQAVFNDPRHSATLTLDSREAFINGQRVMLDSPATIINGRTFVPVRFISEAFEARVDWEPDTMRVIITSFAERARQMKELISFREMGLGDEGAFLLERWGEPLEKLPSEYGFTWWIYHQDYHNYAQVGVENGRVVALYTNAVGWSSNIPLSHDSTRQEMRRALGTPLEWVLRDNTRFLRNGDKESDLYLLSEFGYVEFYYDFHQGEQVTAVKLVLKETEESLQGFLGRMGPEMVTSHERQLFLLANAIRVRMNLQPYQWNDQAARAARKHSQDMGNRNFFAHETPEGTAPLQRILAEGLRITQVGENIAANLTAIEAHEALMNSPGHRASLLSNMTHMGTGTSLGHQGGTFEIYHTQKFISF